MYISIHIRRRKSIQELNTRTDFFESTRGRSVWTSAAAGDAGHFARDAVLRRLWVCCRTVRPRRVVGSAGGAYVYTNAENRKLQWSDGGCVAQFGRLRGLRFRRPGSYRLWSAGNRSCFPSTPALTVPQPAPRAERRRLVRDSRRPESAVTIAPKCEPHA